MADIMTDPMVTPAWLAGRLDDPRIRILDASWFMPGAPRDPAAEYIAGHIPNAQRFEIEAVSDQATPLPHMLAPAVDFAVAMRRLGLNKDSHVVVYDSEGLFSAPRAWWNLRAMGHEDVVVLDGGLPRWTAEGYPVETGWTPASHGDFKAHLNAALIADLTAVRSAVETGKPRLVDARSGPRFRGDAPEPREGVKSGHMPGAANVPWSAVVTDGTLGAVDSLRRAFLDSGVDLSAPIITTCGSGVSAAVLALALARLGRSDVAIYDGSWSEWGGRDDTPIVTGP